MNDSKKWVKMIRSKNKDGLFVRGGLVNIPVEDIVYALGGLKNSDLDNLRNNDILVCRFPMKRKKGVKFFEIMLRCKFDE